MNTMQPQNVLNLVWQLAMTVKKQKKYFHHSAIASFLTRENLAILAQHRMSKKILQSILAKLEISDRVRLCRDILPAIDIVPEDWRAIVFANSFDIHGLYHEDSILDNELESALKFAAQRGVDVSLILPGLPDKKMAYSLAKFYYQYLVKAGVKLYEYTPGFVHAKVFVSDDIKAVVGTINLDYRSLYHHFECATYLYHVDCIPEIEQDFQNTLAKCREVTPYTIKHEKVSYKIRGSIMKLFAPLM